MEISFESDAKDSETILFAAAVSVEWNVWFGTELGLKSLRLFVVSVRAVFFIVAAVVVAVCLLHRPT